MVLFWAPSRSWVLKHSLQGAPPDAVCAACAALAAKLEPVVAAVVAILEREGLNHHDVVSALPFGM